MVKYRRVYASTVKKFMENKGLLVPLIFAMFILMAQRGDITITGWSNDTVCAGTLEEPCYAFINFTANLDIYIYPTNETTWMFNTDTEMKEIVMQRSWGDWWRTIYLNQTWSSKVKYAIKFSKGQDYQLRFIGYKNQINEDIKWGFANIDPIWKGYTADDFFVELISNEAGLTHGEAVFKVKNPTSFNFTIDNIQNKFKGKFIKYLGRDIYKTKWSVLINKTYSENITEYEQICNPYIANETIVENCTSVESGWHWNNYTKEEWRKIKLNDVFKAGRTYIVKLIAYWEAGLGQQSIEWFPQIIIQDTTLTQEKWAWWDSDFPYCRNLTINNTQIAQVLTDYQVDVNITDNTHFQSDWDDTRIVNVSCDAGGSVLDHWSESKSDGNWNYEVIEADTLPASGLANFSIYYGNSTVGNTWDPDAVFDVYSNFSSWESGDFYENETGTGLVGVGGGVVYTNGTVTSSGAQFGTVNYFPENYSVEVKVNCDNHIPSGGGDEVFGVFNVTTPTWDLSTTDIYASCKFAWRDSDQVWFICWNSTGNIKFWDNSTWGDAAAAIMVLSLDTDYYFVIKRNQTHITMVAENSTRDAVSAEAVRTRANTQWGEDNHKTWIGDITDDYWYGNYTWDDYIVRKYMTPEPTYEIGSEETVSQPTSINLTLNETEANQTLTYGDISNITAEINVTGLFVELYKNGSLINNGTDSVTNITDINWFANATYNITASYPGNASYDASSETLYIFVNKAPTETNLTLNGTDGDKEYALNDVANFTVKLNVSSSGGNSSFEYFDNFETNWGNWSNVTYDDDEWFRGTDTGSIGTGPEVGADGTSYFIYVETSSGACYSAGEEAIVWMSQEIDYGSSYEQINFSYHMYGDDIGTLRLQENSTDSWVTLWEKTGAQNPDQNTWYSNLTDLSSLTGSGYLRFNYTCAGSWEGDAAIDQINISGWGSSSGKTVKLDSNYTGWVLQSGASPLMNYTTLNTAGDGWNLTGYFEGDANYSASSETHYFNVTKGISSVILYLNVSSADRYYETDEPANITAEVNVSGLQVCLSINHTDFGVNFTCGATNVTYIWNVNNSLNTLNDSSTTKNLTYTEAENQTVWINLHANDTVSSAYLNLTGYEDGGDYPNSVRIYINDTQSNYIIGDLIEGEQTQNALNDSSTARNVTFTSAGSEYKYIKLPQNANVTSAQLNLSGFEAWNFSQMESNFSVIYWAGYIYQLANNGTHIWVSWVVLSGGSWRIFTIGGVYTETAWNPFEFPYFEGAIYTNNTYLWIVDAEHSSINRYFMNETNDYNFSLHASNDYPSGIVVVDDNVYVTDSTDYLIYKYAMDGTFDKTIDVSECKPHDIAHDGSTFYIGDGWTTRICEYDNYGESYTGTYSTFDSANGHNVIHGITHYDGAIWISDSDPVGLEDLRVYKYSNQSYPYNPYLDVGSDGDQEWAYAGEFNDSVSPETASALASEMNDYLSVCNPDVEGNCNIPLVLYSASAGKIQIDAIEVNYTVVFNPIELNATLINDYLRAGTNGVDVPINFYSSTTGIIEISDIKIDYYGSGVYNVTGFTTGNTNYEVSSDEQNLHVIYSNFSKALPYDWTDMVMFFPKNNNDTNVTPWGQTSSTPIFNITGTAYDKNMTIGIRLNETLDVCLNLTWSNTSTKTNGTTFNTSLSSAADFQTIHANLNNTGNFGIRLWVDLYNCNTTVTRYLLPNFVLKSCCIGCLSCW